VICTTAAAPGPDGYKGKKAVVIGPATRARHLRALWGRRRRCTMVQRSSTLVARSEFDGPGPQRPYPKPQETGVTTGKPI
jgi:hypothetical protein